MRSSKNRSRNKNPNRNRSVGNVINRVFDSSGPEGKVRGTPQQIIDKYTQLARDANLGNDRVAAENFQQHAEHYTRMLAEATREMDARREQQDQQNRDRQMSNNHNNRGREERQTGDDVDQANSPKPDVVHGAVAADATQPDVLDIALPQADNGLVETPETTAKKPVRKPARRPAKKPDVAADTGSDAPSVVEVVANSAEPSA